MATSHQVRATAVLRGCCASQGWATLQCRGRRAGGSRGRLSVAVPTWPTTRGRVGPGPVGLV